METENSLHYAKLHNLIGQYLYGSQENLSLWVSTGSSLTITTWDVLKIPPRYFVLKIARSIVEQNHEKKKIWWPRRLARRKPSSIFIIRPLELFPNFWKQVKSLEAWFKVLLFYFPFFPVSGSVPEAFFFYF